MAIEKDRERHLAAAHGMQAGVGTVMQYNPNETAPKHLRVGINAAMSDQAGLVRLLIAKGVFTEEEYVASIADEMERERDRYARTVEELIRAKPGSVHLA